MRFIILWNPERKADHEQEDSHKREGRQQQVPPAERIDRLHGRKRKHKVHCTKPEASQERLGIREVRLREDVRRIVRDSVHAAELLHEHDDERSLSSSAIAGDSE